MSDNPSVSDPALTDADRVCAHCGKVVASDPKRFCNHCGLPFRGGSDGGPAIDEPGLYLRQLLLKTLGTVAFALPSLGPLSSLSSDQGTLLGFGIVVIAGLAALVFAWRRPLPGGILVALVGIVPFIVELIMDATGAANPPSRYWLFWFFPGGLVGGALFLTAAFWRAPAPSEADPKREGAEGPGRVSLVERVRREAIGLAVLVVVGLVFLAVLAAYPYEPNTNALLPGAITLVGWPLLLVGAGVLGYRQDRARGSFIAGLVAAVIAMVGMGVALVIAGQTLFQVGEGEWIGEAWLVVGLAIVGGGFFGLLGGGITAMVGGLPRRRAHP